MNCLICKGKLEEKRTTFTVEVDKCIIVIKNVPSLVCSQCGKVTYTDEVSKQIEKMVDKVKDTITEMMVIDYLEKVG